MPSANKISKLSTIKGILNGTLALKDLMTQQIYFATISENGSFEVDGKVMNKNEFEQWKEVHFRANIDTLVTIDCQDTINEPLTEYPQESVKPVPGKEVPKREEPVKEEPEPVIVEPRPTKKTNGKLSEYGHTWQCQGILN